MSKFINHVDHVAWVSRIDTVEQNVQELSQLFEVKFEEPARADDLGFTVYLCWEAGLEVVAPHKERTAFNEPMHTHLETRGEGLYAIVFGVRDLAETRSRLIDQGHSPSEPWDGSDPAWQHKVNLKEFAGGKHFNTEIIFSEIEYSEDVVSLE